MPPPKPETEESTPDFGEIRWVQWSDLVGKVEVDACGVPPADGLVDKIEEEENTNITTLDQDWEELVNIEVNNYEGVPADEGNVGESNDESRTKEEMVSNDDQPSTQNEQLDQNFNSKVNISINKDMNIIKDNQQDVTDAADDRQEPLIPDVVDLELNENDQENQSQILISSAIFEDSLSEGEEGFPVPGVKPEVVTGQTEREQPVATEPAVWKMGEANDVTASSISIPDAQKNPDSNPCPGNTKSQIIDPEVIELSSDDEQDDSSFPAPQNRREFDERECRANVDIHAQDPESKSESETSSAYDSMLNFEVEEDFWIGTGAELPNIEQRNDAMKSTAPVPLRAAEAGMSRCSTMWVEPGSGWGQSQSVSQGAGVEWQAQGMVNRTTLTPRQKLYRVNNSRRDEMIRSHKEPGLLPSAPQKLCFNCCSDNHLVKDCLHPFKLARVRHNMTEFDKLIARYSQQSAAAGPGNLELNRRPVLQPRGNIRRLAENDPLHSSRMWLGIPRKTPGTVFPPADNEPSKGFIAFSSLSRTGNAEYPNINVPFGQQQTRPRYITGIPRYPANFPVGSALSSPRPVHPGPSYAFNPLRFCSVSSEPTPGSSTTPAWLEGAFHRASGESELSMWGAQANEGLITLDRLSDQFLQDRDYQQSPHNYRSTMRLEGQIRKLQEDMEQKQKVTRVSWNTLRGNPVGRPPSPSLISGWSEFESAGAGTQVFDEDDDDDDDDIVVLEHIPPNPHKRKQPLDECIETKRQKKDSPAEDDTRSAGMPCTPTKGEIKASGGIKNTVSEQQPAEGSTSNCELSAPEEKSGPQTVAAYSKNDNDTWRTDEENDSSDGDSDIVILS